MSRLFSSFRTNLISGALALAPLAAVIWILAWLWRVIAGLRSFIPESWEPPVILGMENPFLISLTNALTTLILLSLVILFIAVVGMVSRHMLGQRILQSVQKFVNRIPVLRTVYSTLEQLLDTFGGSSQGRNFRRVVMIEYPRQGIYTLALVTGERRNLPGSPTGDVNYLNVFVPTTPNPTSGFFLTIPASDAVEVPLTVEEALKQIISMGIVH